ncbi:MAG TPA: hypothetical protein DCS93_41960 [Microscillaceae bacterium]|nr:hypothetical protein [Microscillaceae bacterium]
MKIFAITLTSLFVCGLLTSQASFAQTSKKDRCATMPMYEKHLQLKWRTKKLGSFEDWMARKIRERQFQRTTETIYEIPVVVHVVHSGDELGRGSNISYEQVLSQMIVLNQDFRRTNPDTTGTPSVFASIAADTKILFKLAVLDTTGQLLKEQGVHRYVDASRETWSMSEIETVLKPATIWDPNKYLNIWVVPFSNSNTLGYAQFPEQSGLQGITIDPNTDKPETDGVVINNKFFGSNFTSVGAGFSLAANFDRGRTATHEVGHWLGLRHIWGDGGCGQDDFCDDTPAAGRDNDGLGDCSFPGPNSCTGDPFDDMFQNYMDYTNDICMNLFTNDQKARMRTVLENSPRRKEVIANANVVLSTNQSQVLANTTRLFPNPGGSNSQLQINNELQGKIIVTITDLRGVILQKSTTTKLNTQLQLDLPIQNLPKGVYVVNVQMKQGNISKRLIKK